MTMLFSLHLQDAFWQFPKLLWKGMLRVMPAWPEGSKDPNNPNNSVLRPKDHQYCRLWALEPYYLGLWTLRVGVPKVGVVGGRWCRDVETYVASTSDFFQLVHCASLSPKP